MNNAFNLSDVAQGRYAANNNNIYTDLKINVDMTGVSSDPTKLCLIAKKYAANSSEISGGVYGSAPKRLYCDVNKVIGSTAYSQMKSYYNTNYNWSTLMNYYNGKLATMLSNYNKCIKTNSTNGLTSYDGKYVKIGTKFYKMFVRNTNTYHVIMYNTSTERMPTYTVNGANTIQVNTDSTTTSNNYMNNIINSFINGAKDDQNTAIFSGQTSWKAGAAVIELLPKYAITLEEVANEVVSMGNISETYTGTSYEYTQGACYDAAYNMFAIPYGVIRFKCATGTNTYQTSKSEGMGIARWLATALGSNIHDLQILPYCPGDNIREYMKTHDVLDLSVISGHYQVIFRAPAGTSTSSTTEWSPCSFVFDPLTCKGTFDITKVVNVPDED